MTLTADASTKTTTNVVRGTSKQQDVAVVSHRSHAPPTSTETIHTTEKHPWLTTKGWIKAGDLHLGDHVLRLDGTTAIVTKLVVVPDAQEMWDLTVSNIHTFAVGDEQVVVHNVNGPCGVTNGQVGSYRDLTNQQQPRDGLQLHHMPSDGVIGLFGIDTEDGATMAIPNKLHYATRSFGGRGPKVIFEAASLLAQGEDPNVVFRSHLARDLWNIRNNYSNAQLREVIEYWRAYAPFLMRK